MATPWRRIVASLFLPGVVGVATGAGVAVLSRLVEGVALTSLSRLPGFWPALFSPLALLVTFAVTRFVTRTATPATAELYIETYHTPGAALPLRQVPGRILAACTTVGFGGSQGLESPSALLGASLGQLLGPLRGFALGPEERRSLLVAGASAGIAAVFSSPGVGMLYGLEVPFRRDVDAPRLVPAAVAAGAAYATRVALVGPSHLVTLDAAPAVDLRFAAGALLVAVASGIAARAFVEAEIALRALAHRSAPLVRASLAGLVLAALAAAGFAVTGRWITFGPGYEAARWISESSPALAPLALALLVRTAGTLTCVYGGGGGGVFTSLACTGVFVGAGLAQVLGHGAPFFALLGGACVLGAAYHIPLATMLYVAESGGGVPFALLGLGAVAIAQTIVGDRSVSDAQHATR